MASIWIVPFALGGIGAALYFAAWIVSRRFDRRYPHLSRKGLFEAEARAAADDRSGIAIPAFRADEWDMRSARHDLGSERLDRSLARRGEQRARHPARAEESQDAAHR